MKPKLRFTEFNSDWTKTTLKDIATINPKNELIPDEFIYIDLESVNKGILSQEKVISKSNAPSRAQRTIKKNDILFQTVRPYQQNNYFVKEIKELPYVASTGYALIRTNENPYFVYSILHKKDFLDKVIDRCTGTSFPAISSNDLGDINIIIPEIKEQTKVSNFLSLLDKKIELQSKKIEDLKLFKKGLIHQMKKSSNNWTEYKISEIFKITRGVVIPKTDLLENKTDQYIYPVYSSQTSNNGILGYDSKFDFDGKYLTWTTDGANAGKVFFRNGKFRCTNVCGVLYNDTNNYVDELTAELLNYETPKHVSYVGNPKLMNNVMGDIKLFLPDSNESDRVSNILLKINNKVLLETNRLNKLNELKKGFMQSMFV